VPAAPKAARSPSAFSNWWNNLNLWRGLAAGGFAAAVLMVAVMVTRPLPTPQYMVVLVAPQDKAPGWVIQTSDVAQLSLVPLGTFEVPAAEIAAVLDQGRPVARAGVAGAGEAGPVAAHSHRQAAPAGGRTSCSS
jgi:anti-sigma-K factor RskA